MEPNSGTSGVGVVPKLPTADDDDENANGTDTAVPEVLFVFAPNRNVDCAVVSLGCEVCALLVLFTGPVENENDGAVVPLVDDAALSDALVAATLWFPVPKVNVGALVGGTTGVEFVVVFVVVAFLSLLLETDDVPNKNAVGAGACVVAPTESFAFGATTNTNPPVVFVLTADDDEVVDAWNKGAFVFVASFVVAETPNRKVGTVAVAAAAVPSPLLIFVAAAVGIDVVVAENVNGDVALVDGTSNEFVVVPFVAV